MCSATTTAYLGVGWWVSLPPCFEERFLQEHRGDSSFTCWIWRGNAVSCLALHKVGHSVRPVSAVFNEVCFSLAGCPEEQTDCCPDTFREAHRSWKLKALFTFPVWPFRNTQYSSSLAMLGTFPLLKRQMENTQCSINQESLCLGGWPSALGRHSAQIVSWASVLCYARTCKFIFTPEIRWCSRCTCPSRSVLWSFFFNISCCNTQCFTTLEAEESWTTVFRQALKPHQQTAFLEDFQMLPCEK